MTWYTDGSSFVVEGKRRAGAAVVDGKAVIWASSLPEGTSAQRAELIALIQALKLWELDNDMVGNIHHIVYIIKSLRKFSFVCS